MRKLLSIGVVAAALLTVPTQAEAGFTMGFRLGLGFPGGELQGSPSQWDLGEVVDVSVPIQFQLGGAFAQDRLSVEGFFELSPAAVTQDFNDFVCAGDCSALGMRVGVLGSFRFMPQKRFTPWVGAGLAYEALVLDDGFDTLTYDGFNWELMGGMDFKLGRVFALGPYASLQLGEYTDVSDGDLSGDPNAGMHSWFQLGVRGRFDF